jgi:hypothetical protein
LHIPAPRVVRILFTATDGESTAVAGENPTQFWLAQKPCVLIFSPSNEEAKKYRPRPPSTAQASWRPNLFDPREFESPVEKLGIDDEFLGHGRRGGQQERLFGRGGGTIHVGSPHGWERNVTSGSRSAEVHDRSKAPDQNMPRTDRTGWRCSVLPVFARQFFGASRRSPNFNSFGISTDLKIEHSLAEGEHDA